MNLFAENHSSDTSNKAQCSESYFIQKSIFNEKILTFRSPSTEINCTIKITLRAFIVFVYNGVPN